MKNIDLVIVCWRREISQLELLLRSIRKFCEGFFRNIFLIAQSDAQDSEFLVRLQSVAFHYPQTTPIFLIPQSALANIVSPNGWLMQQLLKLESATIVNTDEYLVLDTKQHFVGSPSIDDFYIDGAPIVYLGNQVGADAFIRAAYINSHNIFRTKEAVFEERGPLSYPSHRLCSIGWRY